jgi:hypothetical protein
MLWSAIFLDVLENGDRGPALLAPAAVDALPSWTATPARPMLMATAVRPVDM